MRKGDKNIFERLEEDFPEMLRRLGEFIAIPSVSDDKMQVDRALDYMLDLGKALEFQVRSCCDHQVGVIEMGEGEETLGILGHVDVVPAGNVSAWKTEPFKMDIRRGRAYGRGTLDDKGPVMLSLYAMKALKESGIPLNKRIQLILGTQEELEWTDMKRFTEEEKLPDYGFTPDGEYPLCNIEKGIIDMELCFPLKPGDLKPETGIKKITGIKGGTMENTVPDRVRLEIRWVDQEGELKSEELEILGKAVHSSLPENGINPIYHIPDHESSRECRGRIAEIAGFLSESFGDHWGRGVGLETRDEYFQGEYVDRNTFAVTMIRIEEEILKAHLNVRFAYGTDSQELIGKLTALLIRFGGYLEVTEELPAVYVARNRPFIKKLIEAYEEGSGMKHEDTVAYGGSYAKAMPNVVSFGPLFPGEEDTCHQDNEYFDLESMKKNQVIILLSMAKIATCEEGLK